MFHSCSVITQIIFFKNFFIKIISRAALNPFVFQIQPGGREFNTSAFKGLFVLLCMCDVCLQQSAANHRWDSRPWPLVKGSPGIIRPFIGR